jgi:hypothetical protein
VYKVLKSSTFLMDTPPTCNVFSGSSTHYHGHEKFNKLKKSVEV